MARASFGILLACVLMAGCATPTSLTSSSADQSSLVHSGTTSDPDAWTSETTTSTTVAPCRISSANWDEPSLAAAFVGWNDTMRALFTPSPGLPMGPRNATWPQGATIVRIELNNDSQDAHVQLTLTKGPGDVTWLRADGTYHYSSHLEAMARPFLRQILADGSRIDALAKQLAKNERIGTVWDDFEHGIATYTFGASMEVTDVFDVEALAAHMGPLVSHSYPGAIQFTTNTEDGRSWRIGGRLPMWSPTLEAGGSLQVDSLGKASVWASPSSSVPGLQDSIRNAFETAGLGMPAFTGWQSACPAA